MYMLFCLFQLFSIVGKGLKGHGHDVRVRIFLHNIIRIINLDHDGVVLKIKCRARVRVGDHTF